MGEPSSAPRKQSISKDELLANAVVLRSRLARHLDALESGEVGAVDDLAAVLRTLLAFGQGDKVITRLQRAYQVPAPRVFVSDPVEKIPHLLVAFGAILVADDRPQPDGTSARWLDLDSWIRSDALAVQGMGKPINWNKLITEYANTVGSHLSNTIPELLVETADVHAGQMNIIQFLVHNAGLVAESALDQVLDAIVGAAIGEPRGKHRQLSVVWTLKVTHDPSDEMLEFGAGLTIPEVHHPRVDAVKLAYGGSYYRYSFVMPTTTAMRPELDVTDTKPDWWPQ